MIKRPKRKPVIYASDSAYIDPLGCGSTVSYKITRRRRLCGDIHLADCNRKIEWYFDDDPTSVDKIDKAIAMLTEFRKHWVAARAAQRRKK